MSATSAHTLEMYTGYSPQRHTFVACISQEEAYETDQLVASTLCLLHAHDSDDASRELHVKVIFSAVAVAGRFVHAAFLNLSQPDHQLAVPSRRLLSITKNGADMSA